MKITNPSDNTLNTVSSVIVTSSKGAALGILVFLKLDTCACKVCTFRIAICVQETVNHGLTCLCFWIVNIYLKA